MTLDELQAAKDAAMTTEEIRAHRDAIAELYDFAIDTRKKFERLTNEKGWNEAEAEQRLASLIFDDGSDGDDAAAIG